MREKLLNILIKKMQHESIMIGLDITKLNLSKPEKDYLELHNLCIYESRFNKKILKKKN